LTIAKAPPAARHLGRLRDFIIRRPRPATPPLRLWVDITSRCNLRCPACPQRLLADQDRRDMDDALLARLVEQTSTLGVREVNLFHRGEPLLHPEFAAWAGRFKAAGALVRVHSNAVLLTPRKVEGLLEAGPHFFTCSVDSLHPEQYAAARPGADLERVLTGLELLLARRRERGLRLPRVSLLLMGRQAEGFGARARLARLEALGLDRVVRRNPHNWAGAVGALDERMGSRRPAACTFPWYALAVLSDGTVAPCPQDFFGRIRLGDARRRDLGDIWRGAAARSLRRAQAAHRLEDYPVCAACDRVRRPTALGLPLEHLKNFLHESIVRTPRSR
jgi:radical SAM protein with 4Fe4S-binding SPASM domain